MIRQIETKLISVNLIDVGGRHQKPSDTEIDRMLRSIQQDGLLTPIGVRATEEACFSLVYGATRLAAVQKLGWSDVPAVVFEGAPEEFASAELVENLERRHLDKGQRDELTKKLVELRIKAMQSDPQKELDDSLSFNSFQEPKTHPKTKVEGAKRGRPVTAEARAKKEVAAQTGQSVRSVQRATSTKREPAPKKNLPRGALRRHAFNVEIERHIREISKLLAACVGSDREQIRKYNQPYLDGWFGADGKLRSKSVVAHASPAGGAKFAPTPPM
jgi:ParB/RepB/Spo0J family partition protein